MQVTETLSEGLKRELNVVVPASDLEARLVSKIEEIKGQIQINGFRPGKVPASHVRKLHGKALMGDIVQELIGETTRTSLEERSEKAAMQPQYKLTEDQDEADKIMDAKADLVFDIVYEILPAIEVADVSGVEIERPVVEVEEAEIEERLNMIAEGSRPFETKEGAAEDKDRVQMSYLGKVDGEPFEGGADENAQLVLGSGQFIPGFEDQLIGCKAGDEKTIKVTFPADYGAEHLAGKDAEFDVVVKEIQAPGELEMDDEFASKLGLESMEKLKEVVKDQITSQYGSMTRQRVKRQLLDKMDELHKFDVPPTLLEQEFNNIWQQVTAEMNENSKTFEDEDTTEEKAKEEYQTIAERRVRLGLVLSEIGEKNEIQVSDEEVQRGIMSRAQQFPGQERQVFEYYTQNAEALASIRAPIFEEKVVDYLLELVKVEDKTVSKEELETLVSEDEE
ncbi:trigger factor [Cohaesibacter gelatinilyticus]|uniref:Trigger factor n=1 Tax=Cohaesibacter gelatinilyticus TaxID=372072 RepID=A0A285NJY9_9HYPH|nr:trigger factor [Cohaesibacter gelatinilyticus]SNZ07961.1 trigger factor [Cohaesibacter gelatinilyticus]